MDVDAPRTGDGGQMRRYDRAIQDVAGLGAAQARTGDDGAYALTHLAEGPGPGKRRSSTRRRGRRRGEVPGGR